MNVWHSVGTKRERGLLEWTKTEQLEDAKNPMASEELYNLPFGITSCLSSQSWVRFIPFCPHNSQNRQHKSEDDDTVQGWDSKELGVVESAF